MAMCTQDLLVSLHGALVELIYSFIAGTVGFMAPEVAYCQYSQTAEQASPATDFFSLGVVTYMLVRGWRSKDKK